MSIAALIDHTLLAPDVTAQHIRTLCREAVDHGFATVCVSTTPVSYTHLTLPTKA